MTTGKVLDRSKKESQMSRNMIDEIEQRRAHAVNKAWVRSMPDEMLERWYKLITAEHARRKNNQSLDSSK